MRRSSMVLSLMAVVLMAGGTLFGASKTEPAAKGKGHLPTHWTKLGLTDEQKEKIYAVQAKYKDDIEKLQKELNDLKKKQVGELEDILTDEQKTHLRELALKNIPSPTPSKEVTKPDTKPENKPAPDNKLAPKDTKPGSTPAPEEKKP